MLDVHPAHHAATTWREFLIHIATIVLGLIIAVGLEQTVEFFHHRYQLKEARRALAVERRVNIVYFGAQTAEFHRLVPQLQADITVLQYLKDHPHAAPDTWPAKFSIASAIYPYHDSAWHSAQNVLEMMPGQERDANADLYDRLSRLVAANFDEFASLAAISNSFILSPKLGELSPGQTDRLLELTADALAKLRVSARIQRNLTVNDPDFKPSTTTADELSISPNLPVVPESSRTAITAQVFAEAKAAGDDQQ